jgi:hypothetical protein
VSGNWTLPGVTCPTRPYQNSGAFLANWVGVDGFSDGTVEQLGTGDQISASVSVTPGTAGNNNYALKLTDRTRPWESFSTSASCATATCVDSSGEWVIERPAFDLPFGFQILPLTDFNRTYFSAGDIVSGGKYTNIQGFGDGSVYDMPMIDDSASYYLDCVGQPSPPGSLPSATSATACPTAVPDRNGGFETTWDAGF